MQITATPVIDWSDQRRLVGSSRDGEEFHYDIGVLRDQQLDAAAGLCARSMRDNPLHVSVFGADPERRLRRLQRFFSGLLPYVQRKGLLLAAYESEDLIAVCGLLPPGHCLPGRMETFRLLPSLLSSNSPTGLLRLRHWLTTWTRNDLHEPHWHLGPLAVDPPWQKCGVGSRMLATCLAHIDASGAVSYLETDRPVNVAFYEDFGFRTVAQLTVLGVPNWLMLRSRNHLPKDSCKRF